MTTLTRDDTLQLFEDAWLPQSPLASSNLESGLYRMSRDEAVQHRYIETQPTSLLNLMVFDVDRENASSFIKSVAWDDELIPEPNFIVENPGTTHAHAYYILEGRIATQTRAHSYYKSVYSRLASSLQADAAFMGKIARTPHLHLLEGLVESPYTLTQLSEQTALKKAPCRGEVKVGEGRNVDLFNAVRRFAYGSVRRLEYRHELVYREVLQRALELNAELFVGHPDSILGLGEVKATVRSITKFVCSRFSEKQFKKIQGERATRRWDASKDERASRLELILFLKEEGFTAREIGEQMGMTPATVRQAVSRANKKD